MAVNMKCFVHGFAELENIKINRRTHLFSELALCANSVSKLECPLVVCMFLCHCRNPASRWRLLVIVVFSFIERYFFVLIFYLFVSLVTNKLCKMHCELAGRGSVDVAVSVSDRWQVKCDTRHVTPDLLNFTSINSSGGEKISGTASIFVLNMQCFVLNYLVCPIFGFFLWKSSRKSREKVILKFC